MIRFKFRPADADGSGPPAVEKRIISRQMSMLHQETWVRFGTNGIGLSDHQNRYSNGVRVANWVENEFGDHLKKVRQG